VKSRRLRIGFEILLGIVFQIFIVIVFGTLFSVRQGTGILIFVVGIGLSVGLWKYVDEVIQSVSNDPNYS